MEFLKKIVRVRHEPESVSALELWRRDYKREPGGFITLLQGNFNPLESWNSSVDYSVNVSSDLRCALHLKYVREEPTTADSLLARSIAVAERIRSLGDDSPSSEPFAKARVNQCEAYARWIAGGDLDTEMLSRACQHAEAGIKDNEYFFREGSALQAARIALVLREPRRCLAALSRLRKWTVPAHEAMARVLQDVANELNSTGSAAANPVLRTAFDKLFLQYRVPYPKVGEFRGDYAVVRFELAVIRQLYFVHAGEPVDLEQVYESMTADLAVDAEASN